MSFQFESRKRAREQADAARRQAVENVVAAQIEADKEVSQLDVTIDRWDGEGGNENPADTAAAKI